MNWQLSNMVLNGGNGGGGGDGNVGLQQQQQHQQQQHQQQQANAMNRPPATEYTLQGKPLDRSRF
jgi:hypothetical protein